MKIKNKIELVTILMVIFKANGQIKRDRLGFAVPPEMSAKQRSEIKRNRIPPRCQPNPDLQFNQCCIFPPFYVRTVARECGARGRIFEQDAKNLLIKMNREYVHGCDYYRCVLKKYQLLDSKNQLIEEKFVDHLNRWVELNPDFSEIVKEAKAHCKTLYRELIPFEPCVYKEFHKCMRQYVITSCPVPFKTPICEKLTNFYAHCKEYYIP